MVENLGLRSKESTKKVYVRFMNKTKRKANVVWIDYEGMPKKYCTLDPDNFIDVDTFFSHPWIFEDDQTKDKLTVQNQFVFYPPTWADTFRQRDSNESVNIIQYRLILPIRIPVFSLRERCLQVVRDTVNLEYASNLEELQLPKSVLDDLYLMLLRKFNYL